MHSSWQGWIVSADDVAACCSPQETWGKLRIEQNSLWSWAECIICYLKAGQASWPNFRGNCLSSMLQLCLIYTEISLVLVCCEQLKIGFCDSFKSTSASSCVEQLCGKACGAFPCPYSQLPLEGRMAFVLFSCSTKLNALKTKIGKGRKGGVKLQNQRRSSSELVQRSSVASLQKAAFQKRLRRWDDLWSVRAQWSGRKYRRTEQAWTFSKASLFYFNFFLDVGPSLFWRHSGIKTKCFIWQSLRVA